MTTEVSSTPRPDQPKVVEILKRPTDSVELILFCSKNTINQVEKLKHYTSDNGNCKYVPEKSAIYVISRSLSTVSVLARELQRFCKQIKISELIIIKNKRCEQFVNDIIKEVSKLKDIPKLLVIKDVTRISDKDTKTVILNDFHLLPTSGWLSHPRHLLLLRELV
ncbi:hypothetical protein PYW07_007424 [Mythimna separata]|uniref:Uncharacterized protein n=1 Tax=Mythimna separata TaxID=271217 RepID=A0AAD8DZY4_MYTSE|nr:hypothetical protein PYW07_007424 [Mythimna separata]